MDFIKLCFGKMVSQYKIWGLSYLGLCIVLFILSIIYSKLLNNKKTALIPN